MLPRRGKKEFVTQEEARGGREKPLQLVYIDGSVLCTEDEMVGSLPKGINDNTMQYLTDY